MSEMETKIIHGQELRWDAQAVMGPEIAIAEAAPDSIPLKPYYEHAGITIYHGDCRRVMGGGTFRAKLLCTDPPYGIGVSRRAFGSGRIKRGGILGRRRASSYQPKQHPESDWDDAPADDATLTLARSLCEHHIIWGGNYFTLPPSQRWLVWDKRNDGTSFSDCELAWTNADRAVRIFRYRWNGMMQEHAGRYKEVRLHPAMKPLSLMQWCIQTMPEDCDTVLDPFMGSGTTLVAAKNLDRKAIGIEREEMYCEIAAKRLSQEVMQFGEAHG